MDKVFIEGLEIEALIGIYDWERRIRQPLVFDVEMAFDNRVPAASDDIHDTLNYEILAAKARAVAATGHIDLVEVFAQQVARACLDDPHARRVTVRVEKPEAIPGSAAAGVEVVLARA